MDDPLLVEVQSEDYWYEGYNMRTGARGIFPAYYAIEVSKDPEIYRGITHPPSAVLQGLGKTGMFIFVELILLFKNRNEGIHLTVSPVFAHFIPVQ